MKIKKSQFKGYVKHIVREAIEEAGEQIPKGKLAQLNPKLATGGKDKKLSAPTGKLPSPIRKANEAGLTSEMGPESRDSALDDVVRLVIKRGAEKGLKDPQKIAQVATQLFQHQMGMQADPQAVQASVQKHMPMGECGMEENGEEGGYDEKEEVLLIKVMKLIADKLSAMHPGQELTPVQGADEPVGGEPVGGEPVGEPEEPSEEPAPFGGEEPSEEPEEPESEEEPSGNPFGKSEEEPEESPEEPEEPKDDDDDDDNPIKEGSAKTQTSTYKVAPNPSCLTQKDDKDRLDPKDPRLTETKKKGQYKVMAPRMAQVQKDDQAKRVADEPDVNENHKVQARSYMTSNDTANDPQNVRDPEVPMAEAKKAKGKKGKFKSFPACHHSKYTLRDDGGYECSNCGKKRS